MANKCLNLALRASPATPRGRTHGPPFTATYSLTVKTEGTRNTL